MRRIVTWRGPSQAFGRRTSLRSASRLKPATLAVAHKASDGMNPSYFRLRLPLSEAKLRLAGWLGVEDLRGLVATDGVNAVRLACTPEGRWRGGALFMYQKEDWSVFEDLTGGFSSLPASEWLPFAKTDDLVFAGYNDAICWGELVVIADGKVLRQFSYDRDNPETNVDEGLLPSESNAPMTTWIEVASFVDDDHLHGCDMGWLWVREFQATSRGLPSTR